jgi:hypothetical protein
VKIVGIIVGGLAVLVAFPFLAFGIGIVGYLGDGTGLDIPLNGIDAPPRAVAVVSPEFSLDASDLPTQITDASVTFRVTPQPGSAPLFAGLAASEDVARYLKGATIARLEPTEAPADQSSSSPTPNPQDIVAGDGLDVRLVVEPGKRTRVRPPATRDFWIRQADSATGDITVRVADLAGQDVRVVMLRTDGRPGIAADASMRFRIPILATIGWWLLGIGIALALLGAGLIVWMVLLLGRSRQRAATAAPAVEATAADPGRSPTATPAPPSAAPPAVDTTPPPRDTPPPT